MMTEYCPVLDQWISTLKKKGYLLGSMVPEKTFIIHGNFSLHKFFKMEKDCLDNLLKCSSHEEKRFFKNFWKVLWGMQNCSSLASLQKLTFATFIHFMSVEFKNYFELDCYG